MYILHCSLLKSFKTFYLCIVQLSLQQISWRRKKTSCNANNSEFSLELIDPLDCDGIACENASQLYYFWFKNIWLCRIIKRLRFFFGFLSRFVGNFFIHYKIIFIVVIPLFPSSLRVSWKNVLLCTRCSLFFTLSIVNIELQYARKYMTFTCVEINQIMIAQFRMSAVTLSHILSRSIPLIP